MTILLKFLCSINVYELNSKLKYGILNKSYFRDKKSRKHKYGGIHGVCIFIKSKLAEYCYHLDNFESESILWIHLKHTFLQCNFIIGAAYIPHEMSDYYVFDYLTNDIITIKSSYDVPIILLGDFNSRTNIADFEDIFEHEGSILKENPP